MAGLKSLLFVIFASAALAVAMSAPSFSFVRAKEVSVSSPKTTPSNDLCLTCINFVDQSINVLLNIILNEGVIGTCGKLCGELANKTQNPTLGTLCTLFCDIAGIKEFIKIIDNSDLDAFYFCELIPVCPINDNGDAKITSFTTTPTSGSQGTTFTIDLTYASTNGTGSGEVNLFIKTVDGIPLGDSEYLPASKPGTFGGKWTVKAEPDPSCDPTQQECENWLPGTYVVDVAICNGECGSKHPHSAIYDQASVNFTLS